MGIYDVDAMLAEMSSRQLAEWMAYYGMEPFGAELTDVHLARLTAVQVNTAKKQHPLEKFRLWKKTAVPDETFDPLRFYEDLKASLGLKKEP